MKCKARKGKTRTAANTTHSLTHSLTPRCFLLLQFLVAGNQLHYISQFYLSFPSRIFPSRSPSCYYAGPVDAPPPLNRTFFFLPAKNLWPEASPLSFRPPSPPLYSRETQHKARPSPPTYKSPEPLQQESPVPTLSTPQRLPSPWTLPPSGACSLRVCFPMRTTDAVLSFNSSR